jgi:NDP-sugar pyrophosphorylase family protein
MSKTKPFKPRLAFILAGGKSTRLGNLSEVIPKPMMPIHEAEPIIFHNLKLCENMGIEEVVVLLGYKSKVIEHYLNLYQKSNPRPYIYPFVETEPLGTAGFINKFNLTDTQFIVINGDNLYDIDGLKFIEAAQKNDGVTLACTELQDATGFGLVEVKGNQITAFKEKPKTPTAGMCSSGIYFVNMNLPKLKKGYNMWETDIFPKLAKEGKLYNYKKCKFYPTDTLERWQKANVEWKVNANA